MAVLMKLLISRLDGIFIDYFPPLLDKISGLNSLPLNEVHVGDEFVQEKFRPTVANLSDFEVCLGLFLLAKCI